MLTFLPKSIRHKFILLIVLVAVPIAVFDVYQASNQKQQITEDTIKDLARSSQSVVNKLSDLIDTSHELLLGLSHANEITGGDTLACTALLHKIGEHFSKYTNFSFVNRDKYIVCSSGALPKPVHVLNSPNINAAFDTGKFAVSPFKFGVLTGKPILVFSEPVMNERDEVIGAVNNGLSLTWLATFLSETSKRPDERIVVFDGKGTVLASHPAHVFPVGEKVLTDSLLNMAGEVKNGTGMFQDAAGEQMIAAFATIPHIPNGAHVASFISMDVLQEQITVELYQRLTILALLLVASLVLAWVGMRAFLLNPIQRLVALADTLAAGNLHARSDVGDDSGELGRLGLAFNHMAEALDARTKGMARAIEDAERASKVKSEFLASMSHELRTPLNAVLGFAQMMQYDPENPLSEKQNTQIEHILSGGNHLLKLVNDILDLARIEANQTSLTPEDIDAKGVISDAIDMVVPVGEERGVTIINHFNEKPLQQIRTDAVRFKQVVLNLLSNAIKFNNKGGTVIVDGNITDDGFLHISIADSGVGIATREGDDIFNMFHRVDVDPMVATEEGTGIGLTVSKMLITQMAGRIGFESEVGVGSTFWIELPLVSNSNVLIWADALRVGIDAIDSDHQVLVSLLNRTSHQSIAATNLADIILELIDYTQYHFKREELIMTVCNYPDLDNHIALHRKMTKQVKELADEWHRHPNLETLKRLRDFLRTWLIEHILHVDRSLTPYANGKKKEILAALNSLD